MSAEGRIFYGETVETAIQAGLTALRLPREAVEIEILDEGSRGILGIGARMARVRMTPRAIPEAPGLAPVPAPTPEAPTSTDADLARSVLSDLLRRMGFTAEITVRELAGGPDEEPSLVLNVQASGADVLIGPKGETLAALQHIVRLIVNQRAGRKVNLLVDVQDYRERRKRSLERLAEQMAARAVKSGRTVYLEPMPPYERRIIHLALRNRSDVTTQSVGEGNRRRVTIIPRTSKGG
ncbi:MAG: RNA-binding cell elongation regulator Jag/EloR [Anaerolineae bacterium]|nr:protein jag [Anaerolineae bacterium]MCX8067491.1 protein jag [Anaerolineae bacterium]MDW7991640.1 RNA-binding cell elongation regulator Jag/EloR [Anaerolineae bacterium]